MNTPCNVAAVLALTLGLAAGDPAAAEESAPYDLLFKGGTLDEIDRDATLIYQRAVTNTLNPAAQTRDSGEIALSFAGESDSMAHLEFRQGERHRGLGRFPATVGNPMIMYFYESVVRDMAESAGGSPFYIRNRVKESLVQDTEIETGQATVGDKTVETQIVRLHPFEGDPNIDSMKGFGELELTMVMSPQVPGWYLSLTAEASEGDDTAPVYRSAVTFDALEPAR